MVEDDDDDSDYGRPKRRISKVSRSKDSKKSPKPKIRATGSQNLTIMKQNTIDPLIGLF